MQKNDTNNVEVLQSNGVNVLVIGCGGGGNNAINNMIDPDPTKNMVRYLAINTDAQALNTSMTPNRVLIASKNGKAGLGAGAKPEEGAKAAEDSLDIIESHLEGIDMVFIAAGLGGGTGTGAAPKIAEKAMEKGILTIGVVTLPFSFEGRRRRENARKGLEALLQHTDALVEIPNDKVLDLSNSKTKTDEAFKRVDAVLKDNVFSIVDLIVKHGYINLDFADISSILKGAGKSHMGVGVSNASEGEDGFVMIATEKAINSPLLDTSINGAKRVIVNYTASEPLALLDIENANNMIEDITNEDCNFIFGIGLDENMKPGEVKVTILASDFEATESSALHHKEENFVLGKNEGFTSQTNVRTSDSNSGLFGTGEAKPQQEPQRRSFSSFKNRSFRNN